MKVIALGMGMQSTALYLINEDLFNSIDEFVDIKFNYQKVDIIND